MPHRAPGWSGPRAQRSWTGTSIASAAGQARRLGLASAWHTELAHEFADRGVLPHPGRKGAVVAGALRLTSRAGQGEGEGGTGPLGAADGDLPAHRLHQGPHDVEADTGADVVTGSAGHLLGLPERFEAPSRFISAHPDAVVGHADP